MCSAGRLPYYGRGYAYWQKDNKANALADFAQAKRLGFTAK
jgi:hypothetical protein